MNAADHIPTIGLCMIVKNETGVITRCLDSVRPLVDYVLIEDTGSTDGTQELIRDWLAKNNVPGEVIEEPWRDFAYNRSHVMAKLRERGEIGYALIIDADDKTGDRRGLQSKIVQGGADARSLRHSNPPRRLSLHSPATMRKQAAFLFQGRVA